MNEGTPVRSASKGLDTVGVACCVHAPEFPLRRFQQKIVKAVESGRYDRLAISMPRGNGKSWLSAHLLARSLTPGDSLHVPGTESVLCAASLEQARIVFKFLRKALESNPDYRWQDAGNRVGVTHVPSNSRVRALGSKGKSAMGLGSDTRFCVGDEPGAWECVGGSLMADALDTALGKPHSSMQVIYIGTKWPAADGWWIDLLDGGSQGRTFVMLIEADPERFKWLDDDAVWKETRRVNPLQVISRKFRAKLLEELVAARTNPAKRVKFYQTRLNIPTADPATRLLTLDAWKQAVDRETPPREGQPICGVDMGQNRAWTAAVAVWRNGRVEATAMAPGLPSIEDQEKRDRVDAGSYQRLIDSGMLVVDEGRNVPRVAEFVSMVEGRWNPEVIFSDRARFGEVVDEAVCEVVPRVTRWFAASEDIRALRQQVLDGPLSIEHDSVPLLTTSVAVTRVKGDDQGSIRIIKNSNNCARDDVAAALTLAAGALSRVPDNDAPSHVVC